MGLTYVLSMLEVIHNLNKLAQNKDTFKLWLCCSYKVVSSIIIHHVCTTWMLTYRIHMTTSKTFWTWCKTLVLQYLLYGGLSHKHKWNMSLFNSFNDSTCSTKLTSLLERFPWLLRMIGHLHAKMSKNNAMALPKVWLMN
jgi:hypothetical protein